MAEIPDVNPLEIIEVDWGNPIRDRTLQRYDDEIERDNLVPLPASGDFAWIADIQTIQIYDGTGWVNVATGELSFLPLAGGTLTGALTTEAITANDAVNTNDDVRLNQGAVVTSYDPNPPSGPNIFEFQIRNAIMTDSASFPDDALGQDGDVGFKYGF